jgi:hypothetical protein
MPTKVKVIHAHDFVRARAEGVLDTAESERLLLEIASAGAQLDDFDVILDTRKAQSELGVGELWHLAAKVARHPVIFRHKIAVLCPAERFDHGKFFALCAENRGLNVRAFDSYEAAMEWLISEPAASAP